jgi:hypothetical protein
MTYQAKKPLKPCPRCGVRYTENRDGSLRKHPWLNDDVCSQVSEPLKPERRPRKRVSAAESTRGATRVSSSVNDMDLSPAMVKALHYYAAPLAVRQRVPQNVYIPSMRTRRALLERELINVSNDDRVNVNHEGGRVARKIEPLAGTPLPILNHWRHAQMLASEPAPSNVVIPSLGDLVLQIMRYGDMRKDLTNGHVNALGDIRRVLVTLYREAGRE